MEHRHRARVLAFKALFSWELNKSTTFTDILIIESDYIGKNTSSEFGNEIFLGVIDNIEKIDSLIQSKLEHWQLERLEKVDLAILRLSIFSLINHNHISRVITINEAINISKEFGSENSYKFINGILDSLVIDVGV